jgi:hypothetical protein
LSQLGERATSEVGSLAPFDRAEGENGPAASALPATLYCNLGDVTNLAVAQGPNCLFTRISPFGVEGIAQALTHLAPLLVAHQAMTPPESRLASPMPMPPRSPNIPAMRCGKWPCPLPVLLGKLPIPTGIEHVRHKAGQYRGIHGPVCPVHSCVSVCRYGYPTATNMGRAGARGYQ